MSFDLPMATWYQKCVKSMATCLVPMPHSPCEYLTRISWDPKLKYCACVGRDSVFKVLCVYVVLVFTHQSSSCVTHSSFLHASGISSCSDNKTNEDVNLLKITMAHHHCHVSAVLSCGLSLLTCIYRLRTPLINGKQVSTLMFCSMHISNRLFSIKMSPRSPTSSFNSSNICWSWSDKSYLFSQISSPLI